MNQTMVGLKTHSINLYKELRDDADYPVAYNHGDGGIRLANTEAQMDGYRHFASMARGMDVEFEVIDAAECARRHPLISTDNLIGGLWDANDGDIDPASLCQALARRARKAGAEVYRNTPVTGLTQHKDDTWTVHTTKGDIDCEVVVNACGYRVNEVGSMMGVHHPVMSMEHQYFVTEEIQGIVDAGHRMPLLRCPISDYYCRQEKNGLLVGFYEQDCKTWGMDGIDPHFVNALCPDDLDRITDVLEGAFERMPALTEVGIHTVVNGPITYTIDGAPLVGPIPGKRNAFCIIGLRAGLGEGGGHGWMLAQQIVHGEACYDTWCIDPRRFTGEANVELTALKAIEDYQNEFRFHFPNEHRPAGRMAKTTPLTPILESEGAEFTVVNGWERAEFFKPDPDFHVTHSFRFDESHPIVAAEVDAVQNAAGLAEVNGFNRFEITGADAQDFLDWSAKGFSWLSVRECFVGIAPATVMSVSFSGELAYEIHIPNAHLYAAYRALREAGKAHGLKLFGALAVESMRMEKGYLHWKADILTEFDPFETGLQRFVNMAKPDFVGKTALEARQAAGQSNVFVTLTLEGGDAAAHGGASVMVDGQVVGTVTSGGFGHRTGLNLAYAFVQPDQAEVGTALHIDVLGEMIPAKIIPAGPYDPDLTRVRS